MAGKREQAIKNLTPGRKPGTVTLAKRRAELAASEMGIDPKEYLMSVLADPTTSKSERITAANILLPYYHSKKPTQISGPNDKPIEVVHRIELVGLE